MQVDDDTQNVNAAARQAERLDAHLRDAMAAWCQAQAAPVEEIVLLTGVQTCAAYFTAQYLRRTVRSLFDRQRAADAMGREFADNIITWLL